MTCTIEDIISLEDRTEYWTVDHDGNLVEHIDDTDQTDNAGYECRGCDADFTDWDEVTEHLKGDEHAEL